MRPVCAHDHQPRSINNEKLIRPHAIIKKSCSKRRLKSASKRTPQRFALLGRKKSIDCRIEATLKGLRRLLSLSLNSFRLKRRSLACIGWFLWEKSTDRRRVPRRVFSAERVARAMFAQHDPHIISTPLFNIPIFVGEHLTHPAPIHPSAPSITIQRLTSAAFFLPSAHVFYTSMSREETAKSW